MTTATKSIVSRLAVGMGIALGAAQLLRPGLPHPPVTAELQAPGAVKDILRTSCYACHSNEVRLSWFDWIVPVYQLVVHDVEKARARLNFSQLGAEPVARQNAVLFEAVNHIQMGAMPLPRYTRLHPEAAVTPVQLAILRKYLVSLEPQDWEPGVNIPTATTAAVVRTPVQNALNGIAFLPDYRNWNAISSTERRDSRTLRQILANEVATKAIAEHRINPWPDGAILAKVVWREKAAEHGTVTAGEFVHVALMIKDRVKYASTAGWGWAQWNGMGLTPFGNGPDFANDCVACHAPLQANDYVFTMPIPSARNRR